MLPLISSVLVLVLVGVSVADDDIALRVRVALALATGGEQAPPVVKDKTIVKDKVQPVVKTVEPEREVHYSAPETRQRWRGAGPLRVVGTRLRPAFSIRSGGC